jgi:hypothetical protein
MDEFNKRNLKIIVTVIAASVLKIVIVFRFYKLTRDCKVMINAFNIGRVTNTRRET